MKIALQLHAIVTHERCATGLTIVLFSARIWKAKTETDTILGVIGVVSDNMLAAHCLPNGIVDRLTVER